mmetsp:Transcript_36453/g.77527  ORF Transcript_36453/g.77527 Transcript_36453/m.77527 type:complete len:196 (-) Transcript_36453:187-774(-)|eukprot:CAMPEP_0206493114 /NCGR_PEP_ID=MMETSP0324_2-20121206/46699_1 /ASSEMBLY_ACC=CAM_ASM_000836 /TAXON_ID=2866 /ORGANISM="Crypthecodinium cohnii, Strain Seligo" /LENGTH=195 /DNA_ID=CAMNT_0053976035 /DNA_START=81 /DNA_END=668 /DNA_ORIENTATION=+
MAAAAPAPSAASSSTAPAEEAPPTTTTATVSFPAFRSEEWIKSDFDKIKAPPKVLEGQDLMPGYLGDFPTSGLYPKQVANVREQIRVSLFRQALFKVQNTEVTYMEECKDLRKLTKVAPRGDSPSLISLFARGSEFWSYPSDAKLLCEEIWSIDRCGQNVDYQVRFHKEGRDGFSAAVYPTGLRDLWNSAKYYYT